MMNAEEKPAHMEIRLGDEFTIYQVKDISRRLEETGFRKNIILDLQAVTEMDTAGLQLLIWLKKKTRESGIQLSLIRHSEAVLRLFDLYGMPGYFGDKIRIPAEWKTKFPFRYGLKGRKRV